MPLSWVVLLEAQRRLASGPFGVGDLAKLHDALEPGPYGGTLHGRDRYALQVTATGAGPLDALSDVLARWTDAVRRLGLPAWDLVRTEVFTPEELEREFDGVQSATISIQRAEPAPDREPYDDAGHELLQRAFSDPLTGLPDRHGFEHRLQEVLDGPRSPAVVLLDLDAFGDIDYRFGGAAADAVLISLARRFEAMLRPRDVLARLGGDEYGILLEDSTPEAALAIAERLLQALSLLMAVADQDVALSASAGVAVGEPGKSAEAVVGNASAALNAAKAGGGGRAVLYGSEVSHPAQTRLRFVPGALQDRLAHVQLMHQGAVAANQGDTLHQAARVVMRHICAQVGCVAGCLWVPPAPSDDEVTETLWHMAEAGYHPALQETAEELLAGPAGLAACVLSTGRPVWHYERPGDEDVLLGTHPARLQSAFAFPVVVRSEVVAVLAFFSRTPMQPTDSFLDVLVAMGTQLGRLVERQRAAGALRRSAEHLRASEARLREAETLTRLGSWHFDLCTGAGTWSEGTSALYGMDSGQPLDLRSALAAVHADDRPRIEAALSLLVEDGVPFADEIRVMRPDGQVRWHRAQGSAIRDDNGVVVALQGTSQDITETKLAQETLRERERQLAEAQRAARLGCWELELSSGRLSWSEEMYRLWGWEPGQEVTLEAFLATVHPDDRQRLLKAGDRLGETGEPGFVDFRATVAGGSQRWFRGEAHMLFDDGGSAVRLFGTDQDITEQKQAEEELQRAKDLYQRIVETTREGIIMVDAQDVVTFVNPRMAEILGYSVDAMTGMPATSLVDEETHALLCGREKRRRKGMSEHFETQLLTKDGAVVHVLVSASPFMDDDGHYVGALALITDVTALREAEAIVRSQSLRM